MTEKNLLAELATAKGHGVHFLRDAALGVVVLGDEAKADTWVEDCAIASTILHLTCTNLGLGSCWVQIRLRAYDDATSAEERVRRILRIPAHLRVESIISIGHPATPTTGHPRTQLKPQLFPIQGVVTAADWFVHQLGAIRRQDTGGHVFHDDVELARFRPT